MMPTTAVIIPAISAAMASITIRSRATRTPSTAACSPKERSAVSDQAFRSTSGTIAAQAVPAMPTFSQVARCSEPISQKTMLCSWSTLARYCTSDRSEER